MSKLFTVFAFAVMVVPSFAAAQTAPRWLAGRDSTLTFIATQQGAAFEGQFEQFEADIQFAPDQLDSSSIVVTVDTGSVNTRYADRDEALRAPEFFNVMRWPEARFEATEFVALGNDQFQASGQLTIRDQSHPINVPFTFRTVDGGAEMTGEVVVPRLLYGVGQGEWADTTWIGANVRVLFRVKLLR